jgi:hypothetical protein
MPRFKISIAPSISPTFVQHSSISGRFRGSRPDAAVMVIKVLNVRRKRPSCVNEDCEAICHYLLLWATNAY